MLITDQEEKETTFQFLANRVYRPGYMTLASANYGFNEGIFRFNLAEPPVTRGSLIRYMTPRGLHICLSQAGYALAENMANEGRLGETTASGLRETFLESRLRITEFLQRFRREIPLGTSVDGRVSVSKIRLGMIPVLKLNFELGNKAVSGSLTSVIAPKPTHQLNQALLRF